LAAKEIITLDKPTTAKLFHKDLGPDARAAFLKQLDDKIAEMPVAVESKKDRDLIKSTASSIASLKNRIDEVGAAEKEEAVALVKRVDADRTAIWDELQKRQDDVRQPLTDWENAEKARKENIQKKIEDARKAGQVGFGETSAQIQDRIDQLPTDPLSTYGEFEDEAKLVIEAAYTNLVAAKTIAVNAEAEKERVRLQEIEFQRLRDEQAKRDAEQLAKDNLRRLIDIGNGFIDGEEQPLAVLFTALENMHVDETYGDLREQAKQAHTTTLRKLNDRRDKAIADQKEAEDAQAAIDAANKRAADAAEETRLANERIAKLEQDKRDEEEDRARRAAQKVIDDRIAAEAEAKRVEDERIAAEEAELARIAEEERLAEQARIDEEERIERDRVLKIEAERIFNEISDDVLAVLADVKGKASAGPAVAAAIAAGKIRNVVIA
jgi:hypothetical protein